LVTSVRPSPDAAIEPVRAAVVDQHAELARHHAACFGWALACCAWDPAAADDVLQTAYLKVVDGRARFAGRGHFRAFLFGVIRKTAIDERRRQAVRKSVLLGWLVDHAPAPSTTANGVDRIVREETSRRLIAALRTLSARQREVLILVFYHDVTIEDAAEVLGISVGAARVHYERGKARLRKLLRED
jgi:RNA polymerase sigma factor (sigma-70 family)